MFSRKIHHSRNTGFCQFPYGLALRLDVIFHSCEGGQCHHTFSASALYGFISIGGIHYGNGLDPVVNLAFSCNHNAVFERIQLQTISNCYFHLLPLFLSQALHRIPNPSEPHLPGNLHRTF